MTDNLANQIVSTYQTIQPYIKKTPLIAAKNLSEQLGINVFLKCENEQLTNAFKVRGAFSKMLAVDHQQLASGVVTASSGNHGAAVAYAGQQLDVPVNVFLPENAVPIKIDNIRQYGANIILHGTDCAQAELAAQQFAKRQQLIYISPYNDIDIVKGQGTIAHEILDDLSTIDALYVPVGGGGLIAGIAAYCKHFTPATVITGCMPKNSPAMYECVQAGRIVDVLMWPTLSDATAGNIEPGAITLPLCQQYVDNYVLATETEIKATLEMLYRHENLLVEGAVGVCLAALQHNAPELKNKNVVIVISGGNVSEKVWE